MDKATLIRIQSDDRQTLGHFTLYHGIHKIFECKTLELPDKNNLFRQSRIPAGLYRVIDHNSPKYGNRCYKVHDVPGRSEILIHLGNYHTDILGCILPGKEFTDINGDGYRDVTSSGNTLDDLKDLTTGFWLQIIDHDILLNE